MVRYASKAAELDPLHDWYPIHIAYAYAALGDFDMALAYFDRVQSMSDSRQWRIRLGRAWALLHSGRKDEAIAIFESMLWRPDDMLYVLASFDIAAGHSDEALARYRQFAPECFNTDKEADAFFTDCPGKSFLGFARVLQEQGDSELVAPFVDAWIRRHEEWFEKYLASTEGYEDYGQYEPMAAYAIAGRQSAALSKLETYVEQGWRGYQLFDDWRFTAYFDFTLDAIRDHPRFQAAIAVIEADMAQQLENVREMERKGELPTLKEFASAAR
jgi:tetratricopeptide (TPR) repeat protein